MYMNMPPNPLPACSPLAVADARNVLEFTPTSSLRHHLETFGARFADLGSSQGNSRRRLETSLRLSAGMHNKVNKCFPVAIGLDIMEAKLRICNGGRPFDPGVLKKVSQAAAPGSSVASTKLPPLCVKADLRGLYSGSDARKGPLFDGLFAGTQMIDILEHINRPLPPAAAAAVPPGRRREVWNATFDTADHAMALSVWTAACMASRLICVMEGPGFDGEEWLQAHGFAHYYARWSGHTSHVNSTSMVGAIKRLPRARKAAKLVMLAGPVPTAASNLILRLPPNPRKRACVAHEQGRFGLGCDRHAYGSKEEDEMRKTHQAGHAFKYPKDASAAALNLASRGIYERMVTVVVYDFDPETNTMSAASAAAMLSRGENVVRGKPVFCQLPGPRQKLSAKECHSRIIKAAKQALRS